MKIKEALQNLGNHFRREPEETHFSVTSLDLRDPEKAQEQNYEPGFYFILSTTSPNDIDNPTSLIDAATPLMLQKLQEEGFHTSDKPDSPVVPLGWENDQMVGIRTDEVFMFKMISYKPDKTAILVRPVPADPQEALISLVSHLRKR
ncbi:MAG TPA: hypothetical protein VJ044_04985 [Candidatus Hodarchaeales archaeon]|uniref:Uncharacterized protein n=2 Tax=Candidatus Chisholmiibacteriota TaxID=1817900 RepID=A0A1G1VMV6_9BACT|nr:MAG: hypothetical protein A2785_01800 [Candidatus Chisholmbacteria bacterium RIFCSPHIGHO2_01_FULL_49_18]OGY21331.1 MAG: hypothetical protein A3A65_05185 [Candidatus Chisholmbacteria bacterium RIFCSPLOWO2_01_FULL_49_14]HKZ40293.1 hypothetical protein [Candidatus Hodarchaeales archaeon]